MTAMNLYLADARMLEARQTRTANADTTLSCLIAEIVQVLKGALVPANSSRAVLGDALSRDLGVIR